MSCIDYKKRMELKSKGLKMCRVCKIIKKSDCFNKVSKKNHLRYDCKECRSIRNALYYQKKKQEKQEKQRQEKILNNN